MSSRSVAAFAVLVVTLWNVAWGDDSAGRADLFLDLLRGGKFPAAAATFHYPPTYTSDELAADQAGVAKFLEDLFREVGELKAVKRISAPSEPIIHLSIGGGDGPYWASHPELSDTTVVNYEAKVTREGVVFLAIMFVRPRATWEIRAFEFGIPLSRPGSKDRIAELSRKLFRPSRRPRLSLVTGAERPADHR